MFRSSLLLLTLTSSSIATVAQTAPPTPTTTTEAPAESLLPPLRRPVNVTAGSRSADDELLELARSAHVNLLADASEMEGATTESSRRGPLYGHLNSLSKQAHLTWLQSTRGTFLAWHEPNALALARQIAADTLRTANLPNAQVKGSRSDTPSVTVPVAPDAMLPATTGAPVVALDQELTQFFSRPENQVEGEENQWQDVPLVRLPAQLQAQVLEAVTARDVTPRNALWFSDDFWKGVRLHIKSFDMPSRGANGQMVRTPTPTLLYGGSYSLGGRRGIIMRGLGFVPVTSATAP